jgi:hypothetical protein
MTYRFPLTKISNPFLPLTKIRFHFLIKVALSYKFNQTPALEVYIDTGSPWCLFDGQIAQRLGIKDYRDTKNVIPLRGIGGLEENKAYFWEVSLVIFKDFKKLNLDNSWKIDVEVGFLEKSIGFPALLGVYGFLDHFSFKVNVPEGYFEIEPLFD